ncbi:hypothetical protein CPC08DRAFT_704772 [Agrocybe pediades]|nr:hypothetical protein CPC08DRAFT_704772 [Agrocybe pediades]
MLPPKSQIAYPRRHLFLPSTVVSAASAKPIALSTVIGSCVGAFIGATALIVLGLWLYRRYSQQLKQRSRRGPVHTRNAHGDEQRRRSRLEPWNKLGDDDDKWEDMYQTKEAKEIDHVAPMEKLTMFKKTPSVRTAYTHKSTDIAAFHYPQSYADFDPKLAQTLTIGQASIPETQSVQESKPESPWETDTVGKGSFLTIHTQVAGGGSMSPTLQKAIPTPPPTVCQTHKWESAEVVHHETDNHEENRRSAHNPFFNARDYQPRSRSNSVSKSPKAKGKEPMRYSTVSEVSANPFDDNIESIPLPPKPTFVSHTATASKRALQSLDQVRDRLRIASMQPSIISQVSSVGGFDEDVTNAFPLPPLRNEGLTSNLP